MPLLSLCRCISIIYWSYFALTWQSFTSSAQASAHFTRRIFHASKSQMSLHVYRGVSTNIKVIRVALNRWKYRISKVWFDVSKIRDSKEKVRPQVDDIDLILHAIYFRSLNQWTSTFHAVHRAEWFFCIQRAGNLKHTVA